MSAAPISVLKFGSSVLRDRSDLARVVHEIYRELRLGRRVVAVVSAIGKSTDRLLEEAGELCSDPDPLALATFVGLGERRAAASLALALDRAGVAASVFDESQLELRTSGPPLDSSPISIAKERVLQALIEYPVLVAPGFLGRGARGEPTLLGRGGSDLTAIFLGHWLKAERVRLVKDVDGLYERDPARDLKARRYARLSFEDALRLGGRIVQEKAILYAREHERSFEVGALLGSAPTIVGKAESRLAERIPRARPLSVASLGLGTVGLGVRQELLRSLPQFELGLALVRDRWKNRPSWLAAAELVEDPQAILAAQPDVLVELLGGLEPATELVAGALARGISVVSANKELMVARGREFQRLAEDSGARLLYSAAVGGALPVLETLRQRPEAELVEACGILNTTCNVVLDLIAGGHDFESALAEARRLGFAEADPARDLSGQDAAHKLELIAREAFGARQALRWVARAGIGPEHTARAAEVARRGGALRQVARLRCVAGAVEARLGLEELEAGAALTGVGGPRARLALTWRDGYELILRGRGAGRWPTTEAVLGDLIEIAESSVIQAHALALTE